MITLPYRKAVYWLGAKTKEIKSQFAAKQPQGSVFISFWRNTYKNLDLFINKDTA